MGQSILLIKVTFKWIDKQFQIDRVNKISKLLICPQTYWAGQEVAIFSTYKS